MEAYFYRATIGINAIKPLGAKRFPKTDFWDTAGQERFSSMHPSYYYRAHACILVFDVTRKATYKSLADWYGELRQYCEGIPCLLVANKIDVDYNVSTIRPLMVVRTHCNN